MFRYACLAALSVGLAGPASAAVVQFSGDPATTFADGTFTNNLSGLYPDGFTTLTSTSAYNAYGQDNLSIIFTNPVTLNSLQLGQCGSCFDATPTAFIANLYDSANSLLTSGSVGNGPLQTLTFNQAGVKTVTFTFTGNSGNPYADGRSVAWYVVNDVTYNAGESVVPEPAAWAMFITGFALTGASLRRRRPALA